MSAPYSDTAREYLAAGWTSVLPLPPGAKTPPPAGFTGAAGADPDDETIARWEREQGDGNVALRLPDGIVGIDVDAYGSKHGQASLAALEAELGALPPTWWSTARSDGVSGIRFYRVPVGTRFGGELGKDIDVIQRHHRYAVVWPSTNPKAGGAIYRWLAPGGAAKERPPRVEELPELPAAWVTALSRSAGMAGVAGDGAAITIDLSDFHERFELPEEIVEGERNATMFRYACSLVGRPGIRGGEALELLTAAFRRCDPPWTDETPERLLARARATYGALEVQDPSDELKRRLGDPGRKRHIVSRAVELSDRREAERLLAANDVGEGAWGGNRCADIDLDAPEPGPRELCYGQDEATGKRLYLFAPGATLLFGASESGKSWLVLETMRQAIEGGGHVLMLDFEMSLGEVMRRLDDLGLPRRLNTDDYLTHVSPPGRFSEASMEHLMTRLAGRAPRVVVIDAINGALSTHNGRADSNSTSDIYAWRSEVLVPLQRQWPYAVFVIVDHVPHVTDGSPAVRPIGSQAKKSFADAMFSVEKDDGGSFSRTRRGGGRIVCRKSRGGWFTSGEVVARYQFGGGEPFALEVAEGDGGGVGVDLAAEVSRRVGLLRFVGDNEGCSVTVARGGYGGRNGDFTQVKEALTSENGLEERSNGRKKVLFKGPRWAEILRGHGEDVPSP